VDWVGFESKMQNLHSEFLKNERERNSYAIATTFLNSGIIQQQQYIIQLAEQIKKIVGLGEFGPLIKVVNGESVPVPELLSFTFMIF
jgi:hypothetical protein